VKELTQSKENKMGIMPIKRLLIHMSLPMMISMLVQALYNVVDSIFVARINESALTAVSLAFPVQNLMIAIGVGTGVGMNALLSRTLGEGNFKESNRAANNGIFLGLISYGLFLVFGLLFSRSYFAMQTNDPIIIQYGTSYLSIICIASIGLFNQIIFERLLQSTGKSFYSMITQGTGAIINIILDPILIFGYFGMPEMGVTGAAIATISGQIFAAILGLIINIRINKEISIKIKGFRPNLGTIRNIYKVGIPSMLMISLTSVTTYGVNHILMKISTTATAVLGVYHKLQSFVFMPIFGLNNGMVPIIAYNYGARKKDRVIKAMQLSITYAVVFMLFGFIIIQMFPGQLLSLFNASEDMLSIGIPALRIISLSYTLAGFGIVCDSIYQAFGNGMLSLIVGIARQLAVLLPAAYVLSLFGNVHLIWWAYFIAEIVSAIFSIIFLKYIYRQKVVPIEVKEKRVPITV
jgi:putative MATE family efflux protein